MAAQLLIIYTVSSLLFVLYERQLSNTSDSKRQFGGGGVACLAIGAVLQIAFIREQMSEGKPAFLDLQTSLSGLIVCWVGIGIFFIVKFRVYLMGIFVAPFACITSVAILLLPRFEISAPIQLTSVFTGPGLIAHASFGFLGYAAYFCATLGGGLYLIQNSLLKSKQFGVLFDHLPPLETAVKIMSVSLATGVVSFSLAVLSAVIFLRDTVSIDIIIGDPIIDSIGILWLYGLCLLLYTKKSSYSRKLTSYFSLFLGILVIVLRILSGFVSGLHTFTST